MAKKNVTVANVSLEYSVVALGGVVQRLYATDTLDNIYQRWTTFGAASTALLTEVFGKILMNRQDPPVPIVLTIEDDTYIILYDPTAPVAKSSGSQGTTTPGPPASPGPSNAP